MRSIWPKRPDFSILYEKKPNLPLWKMTHNPSCFGVQSVLMEQNKTFIKFLNAIKMGLYQDLKNASRRVPKARTLINKKIPTSKGGKRLYSFSKKWLMECIGLACVKSWSQHHRKPCRWKTNAKTSILVSKFRRSRQRVQLDRWVDNKQPIGDLSEKMPISGESQCNNDETLDVKN